MRQVWRVVEKGIPPLNCTFFDDFLKKKQGRKLLQEFKN